MADFPSYSDQLRSFAQGLMTPSNMDLMNRPVVRNPDGSVSTVRSMSVNFGNGEVLLPTISDDGRVLTADEAIAQHRKTGMHLGVFDTPENATNYAKNLSRDQARIYQGR